jgi:hypothetical protein
LNNDNYVDKGIQTFNSLLKNKDVQIPSTKKANVECMTNSWGIYDAYADAAKNSTAEAIPEFELRMGMEISKAAMTNSTALTEASTELLTGRASLSRSAFVEDVMSETVFSSVFGAVPSEVNNAQTEAVSTTIEKDITQVSHF